jgi:hypothetical protein
VVEDEVYRVLRRLAEDESLPLSPTTDTELIEKCVADLRGRPLSRALRAVKVGNIAGMHRLTTRLRKRLTSRGTAAPS